MRGSRALIMLALALIAGIAAVVLASRWLVQQTAGPASQQVVVAARDIDLGSALNATMLEIVPWPAGALRWTMPPLRRRSGCGC